MKRSLLFFIGFFFIINGFSQNRNNIWYFGNTAGLNFNTNPPTTLDDGTFNQYEGSATIADNNGNLLFYTQGSTVWNRNHIVMPNGTGLLGENSATQSALIIPKPCDSNIYYIFTVPMLESGHDSLYYSILDMSLNNGLGDIAVKNIFLRGRVKEKLTGTVKSNGVDYWILVKENTTNNFLAFTLDINGINPVPVISNAGVATPSNVSGYLKISPDNTKLCAVYNNSSIFQLFDFNNNTGQVSNAMSFSINHGYGAEFSPDNTRLYVGSVPDQVIHQFNLLAGSETDIENSDVVVGAVISINAAVGSLKLGPDNKIYVSVYGDHYISVIDQPNQLGIACNFIRPYISLANGICKFGLPNNLNAFSLCGICPSISAINSAISICANQMYQLPSGNTVSDSGIYLDTIRNNANTCDSIIYTINLSVSPVSLFNTNVHICPNQAYQIPSGTIVNTEGVYSDTIRNIAGCDSIISSIHLFVDHVTLQNTYVHICPNQTYQLPSGTIVGAEGIYLDTLRSQAFCDSIVNTIHLFVDHVTLQNADVHICPNQTYQLPSGTILSAEGVYVDTLRSQASCDSIINTIHVFVDHVSLLNTNVSICSNQTYLLPSGIIVNTTGTYVDTLRSQAFCDSIINTIYLLVNNISNTNHLDSIFEGQTYTLPSGIIVSTAGTYLSTLINTLGCDSVVTTVLKLKRSIAECITLKNAFTPNGDGINDFWILYKYNCFKKLEVNVYNRYGSLVYHADDYKNNWNGKYKNKELPDGTYYYIIKLISFDGKEHLFKDNVTILR